jgi:hypothetical protein
VVWKSYATSEQFRYIHEQILMLLKKHGVGKVLGDDTVVPLIHARDQIWITNDWFPRAVAAGLKVGASKKPVAQSRQAPIDRIQSQTPSGLTIRSFDDLEDARRWLKNSG